MLNINHNTFEVLFQCPEGKRNSYITQVEGEHRLRKDHRRLSMSEQT